MVKVAHMRREFPRKIKGLVDDAQWRRSRVVGGAAEDVQIVDVKGAVTEATKEGESIETIQGSSAFPLGLAVNEAYSLY